MSCFYSISSFLWQKRETNSPFRRRSIKRFIFTSVFQVVIKIKLPKKCRQEVGHLSLNTMTLIAVWCHVTSLLLILLFWCQRHWWNSGCVFWGAVGRHYALKCYCVHLCGCRHHMLQESYKFHICILVSYWQRNWRQVRTKIQIISDTTAA